MCWDRAGQAADYVAQCVCVPILSTLSDTYGRRPIALTGVLGLVLASLALVLSTLTASVPWFIVGVITQGAQPGPASPHIHCTFGCCNVCGVLLRGFQAPRRCSRQ